MFKYIDALNSLYPNMKFGIDGNDYDTLSWGETDITKPTEEIILNELDRINVLWPIQNNRRNAYPSIGDQLDALFHAGVFPEGMAANIQAVKDKYPKPQENNS